MKVFSFSDSELDSFMNSKKYGYSRTFSISENPLEKIFIVLAKYKDGNANFEIRRGREIIMAIHYSNEIKDRSYRILDKRYTSGPLLMKVSQSVFLEELMAMSKDYSKLREIILWSDL